MHLTSTGGFERDVPTYTTVSKEDEEEYSRIEELKNDYDELYYEVEYYKEAIRIECQSFLESSMKKDNKDKTVSNNKEYICPNSDVKKLSLKDVKKLSKTDRSLAKNEIYARYGRKFNDESLQKYFEEKSWYSCFIEPEDFDESVFNKTEKYNIKLLAKYE